MKQVNITYPTEKKKLYSLLKTQLIALTDGVPHMLANFSNASALLNQALTDINWVGFYFIKENQLVLGTFQGKPACIEIKIGNGVCGTAVSQNKTIVVENVHDFPGHIACDSASNSEIVIPIHAHDKIIGVLDIDSPIFSRFDEEDKKGLEMLVRVLEEML
ncbi:GAF domain-containing protein [Faecalimonas sp.]